MKYSSARGARPAIVVWPIDLDNEPVPDYLDWEEELGWEENYEDEGWETVT